MSYKTTAEFDKKFKNVTVSDEQNTIFEKSVKGIKNMCVSASAGTGKSTAIVGMVTLLDKRKKKLILMHNKSVKNDMIDGLCELYNCSKENLVKDNNITVNTVHGFGYHFLYRHKDKIPALQNKEMKGLIKDEADFNQKYYRYIREHVAELSDNAPMNDAKKFDYCERLTSLVHFSQINLCQTAKEVRRIADRYGINCLFNEDEATVRVLKWGKSEEGLKELSYSDLLWLPYEMGLNAPMDMKFDYIFVDEVQDLSPAHVNLLKKLYRRGVKVIIVGDKFQQINSWCGASDDAMHEIENACGGERLWESLKLTTNYRCDQAIIDEAKKANEKNNINVEISARNGCGVGKIAYGVRVGDIPNGSLILCRITSPLIELYLKLIEQGHCVAFKGEDSLKKSLMGTISNLNGKTSEEIYTNECREFVDMLNETCKNYECDESRAMKTATVFNKLIETKTVRALANAVATKDEMINLINEIGDVPESKDCITLSTIHRAKGAQADNVYIACPSFIQSPFVNEESEWEVNAEKNLEYVAKTRAKHVLGYIDERDIRLTKNMDTSQKYIMDEVEEIKQIAKKQF